MLVDLGAQLERELSEGDAALASAQLELKVATRKLLKPGLKLVINLVVGVAGLLLAPVSIGLSLLLTTISSAVTVSDMLDFAADIRTARRIWLAVRFIGLDIQLIVDQLAAIEGELERRIGSP